MQPSQPSISLRKLVVLGALQLSALWDLVTTGLGILLILDNLNLVAISLAVIGTLIVVAFNFSTQAIWRRRQRLTAARLPLLGLRLVWLTALLVDLWTSLTCNAWFIGEGASDSLALGDVLASLSPGQLIIVVFVTLITGISPMLVGYLHNRDINSILH